MTAVKSRKLLVLPAQNLNHSSIPGCGSIIAAALQIICDIGVICGCLGHVDALNRRHLPTPAPRAGVV
jgi:hypothetical protein